MFVIRSIIGGLLLLSLTLALSQPVWGQIQGPFLVTAGPGSWGTTSGAGLVGMSLEVAQRGVSLEALLGIGTNRVQGWALWPRIYLAGERLWPFGELPLFQVTETEIAVDPERGLVKNTYTWQFIGVGVGLVYASSDRSIRVSGGLGVSSGQCLPCGVQAYLSFHIGISFQWGQQEGTGTNE